MALIVDTTHTPAVPAPDHVYPSYAYPDSKHSGRWGTYGVHVPTPRNDTDDGDSDDGEDSDPKWFDSSFVAPVAGGTRGKILLLWSKVRKTRGRAAAVAPDLQLAGAVLGSTVSNFGVRMDEPKYDIDLSAAQATAAHPSNSIIRHDGFCFQSVVLNRLLNRQLFGSHEMRVFHPVP